MLPYDLKQFSSLEFDTADLFSNSAPVFIDDTHFVLAWEGTANDGFVRVFEVNTTTKAITALGASALEYQTTQGTRPQIYMIDATHFLLSYLDLDDEPVARVYDINTTTWAITASNVAVTLSTTSGTQYDLIPLNASAGKFMVAYGTTTNKRVRVVNVNTSTWAITLDTAATLDNHSVSHYSLLKMENGKVLVTTSGADGLKIQIVNYDTGTYALTVVSTVVQITGTASYAISTLLHDTNKVLIYSLQSISGAVRPMVYLIQRSSDTAFSVLNSGNYGSNIASAYSSYVGKRGLVELANDHYALTWGYQTVPFSVISDSITFGDTYVTGTLNPAATGALSAKMNTIDAFIHVARGNASDGFVSVVEFYGGNNYADTVKDNFNNNSLGSLWYSFNSASETNGQIELSLNGASANYHGIYTQELYDLRNSEISVQLKNAGNQAWGSIEVELQAIKNGDSDNRYFMGIFANELRAYETLNGSTGELAVAIPYNSATMKWLRIRHVENTSYGTLYFEYSADGINWTLFKDSAANFSVADMQLELDAGNWDTETGTTTVIFDNFNYLPLSAEASSVVGNSLTSVEAIRGANATATIIGDALLTAIFTAHFFTEASIVADSITTAFAGIEEETTPLPIGGEAITNQPATTFIRGIHPKATGSSSIGITGGIVLLNTDVEKRRLFKVYNSSNVYLGTLNDVINDPSIPKQINIAGSEVTLNIARPAGSFGSHDDLKIGNQVQCWIFDKEAPNGICEFIGEITNERANHDQDYLSYTITGYGYRMHKDLIETGDSNDVTLSGSGSLVQFLEGSVYEHTFETNVATSLSKLIYRLRVSTTYNFGDIAIWVFDNETDCRAGIYANALTDAMLGVDNFGGVAYADYHFTFPASITTTPATKYYVRIECTRLGGSATIDMQTSVGNDYVDGDLYMWNGSTWVDQNKDPYMIAVSSSGSTTAEFLSVDPADIFKAAIDDHNTKGGKLTYTVDSIDDTGTTVSYTFNTNTYYEVFDKALELCPEGWYYYIDQSVFPHVVHLHQKSEEADHVATLGKDIVHLDIEKTTENLVNIIFFRAGLDSSPIYKKYSNPSSISTYGRYAIKFSDQRVTLEDTMDIIASRLMRPTPDVILDVVQVDSNLNDLGYDIESIVPGQTIRIANTGQGPASRFDYGNFDEMPFDYDLDNVSSIIFQVTGLRKDSHLISYTLSTKPPDIAKRIQDIKRNIDDLQNANNPDTPQT